MKIQRRTGVPPVSQTEWKIEKTVLRSDSRNQPDYSKSNQAVGQAGRLTYIP
jgi:hypothetical protein